MAGLKVFPEAMNPWVELARKAMAAHMEWLTEFGKIKDAPEKEKTEKS